jgi:hypothetical protein
MTIKHVYHDDNEPEETLEFDRNFETGLIDITIDRFGDRKTIAIPYEKLVQLVRHVGLT